MAIVHVRLDVDSDVHPELYAMLVAIDRAASRAERTRQLASSGLIWEHLRVQGPVQVFTQGQVDIEVGTDPVAQPALVAPPPAAPVAPPPPAPSVEDITGPAKRAPRPRAGPPRNLPVLYDSVELSEVEGHKRAAAAEGADVSQTAPADPVPPPPSPTQKTGPRPRLMRMKEKGLFNNG
jgi:hypothetical protein